MELEDLKNIWKSNAPGFEAKDELEIAAMLKGNSKSIIDKLKRSVWFELIFTIFASVGLLFYAITLPVGALKWTSISLLVVIVGYKFYYVKKLIFLNRFNPGNENLKENLQQFVKTINGYLKFYKRSYTILYPAYFFLALFFGLIERGPSGFFEHLAKPSVIVYLIAIALVCYVSSRWFVDWYLKKLYGDHLEKLNRLLNDLHE